MNIPKLLLNLLAASVLVGGIVGGVAVGVGDDAPPPEKSEPARGLDRWTDHHQAGQQGEDRDYLAALREEAAALDELTMDELRARVRPHVLVLEDEARWINFIIALMPVECVRNLPWPLIISEITRLQALVGMNLHSIQFGVAAGGDRARLQQAIVQAEKELPVIRKERGELANRVIIEILGGSVGRSGVDIATAIHESLAASE